MKVAIVGAGVSGLSAAFLLRERAPHARIEIFEMAADLGGRMATQRVMGSFPVDTGCQFLSIDQDFIYDFFVNLAPADAIQELPQSILCLPEGFIVESSQRYSLEQGMTQWAAHVVEKLQGGGNFALHLSRKVDSLAELAGQGFTHILVSAPGPQGQALGAARSVEYHPCLTLIFQWHQAPREALNHYAYRDISSREGITWLAHEGLKRGRPGLWLAQASPATSVSWFEAKHSPDELEDLIQADLGEWIPLFAEGTKTFVDQVFWRNAFPVNFGEPGEFPEYEKIQKPGAPVVYFMGDGYKGVGRTENAIESAFAVVEDLIPTRERVESV